MGKVQLIQKSRKEHKCSKCRAVIPVGSKYYKGTINFHPDIVRCTECKLEHWEVTTSDYQLQVGEIVYRWQENYGCNILSVEEISNELESIKDDLQDRLDNMPEQLQESDSGTLLQERIECLETAIEELDNIDEDELKEEVVGDYEDPSNHDEDNEVEWDDDNEDMVASLEDKIAEAIESALSNIEV